MISLASAASVAASAKVQRQQRYVDLVQSYFSEARHPFANEESWLRARRGVLEQMESLAGDAPSIRVHVQSFDTEIMVQPNIPLPVIIIIIIISIFRRKKQVSFKVSSRFESVSLGSSRFKSI